MPAKRRNTKVKTVFGAYFRKHQLNQLVKNLYVKVPDMSSRINLVRRKWGALFSSMMRIFDKSIKFDTKIAIVDLNDLQTILAARMKEPWRKSIILSEKKIIEFEQVQLKELLEQQKQLLNELLEGQRRVLSNEAKKILQQEKDRINQRFNHKDQV